MENLPIAKPLMRQMAKMPLNTVKLLCALLIAREVNETEMCFSVNRLVTLASGARGGSTERVFLPVAQSLADDTFVTVEVKAKDLLDYSKDEDPEKVIRVSGPLISTSVYDQEKRKITFAINPDFLPILDGTKSNWITLDLEILRKIRGEYEFKLYCWLLTHLGGHERLEFEWHLFGSGEKEASVAEYFDLESKKGFRTPSDIKVRIFERYLPKLQSLIADTIDLQWSYIEKKRAYPRGREHAKFIESIHITVTRKNEKTTKKERPNQDVGEGKSPNSRLVRPAISQQKYSKENDNRKPEKVEPKKVSTKSTSEKPSLAPISTEIKTITDFYNESIEAKAGSDQAYSYSTIRRYASPLLESGWSVERICSLIEANRAYYEAVKHPEHVKKPRLVFNVEEERLDKLRPFMKPMREILIERYTSGGGYNGSIARVPAKFFWLLDQEAQERWLDIVPYESMPKDIQEEYDRRYYETQEEVKKLLAQFQGSSWANGANEKAF